jgi:hypothetical protein
LQNNIPPTDDCTKNWKTIQNLERLKSEYFDKRRREIKEKDEPVGEFISRKRPEKRNDQYIDNETGLFKPYGKHSEFHPNKTTTKRHYKNMKPMIKFSDEVNQAKEKVVEI